MNRIGWIGSMIISLGWMLTEAALAVQPAGQDPVQVGDLSTIFKDYQISLEEVQRWIGPEAVGWTGIRTSGPEMSFTSAGQPFHIPGYSRVSDQGTAIEALQAFVDRQQTIWGEFGSAHFKLMYARDFGHGWHVILEQAYQGIPVYGSRIEGKINREGELISLRARLFPAPTPTPLFALPEVSARRALTEEPSGEVDYLQKIYFPRMNGENLELLPCYHLRVTTSQADLRPAGIVDARTGELYFRYNDVRFEELSGNALGLVLPAYYNDPPQSWPQRHQWFNVKTSGVAYTDSSGHYSVTVPVPGQYLLRGRLYGLYASVLNDDGAEATATVFTSNLSPQDYLWTYDMGRQDEINVYYHETAIHDFYKSINPEFTDLDYPLPATVGYGTNYENAFWNGTGIFFGTGGGLFRNFALFSDVIYHEFGHGVNDKIYPAGVLPYTGQSGAMDEGWADYFACSLTNEPLIGEGGLQTNNQPLRNLDNNLVYPLNWVGEVHADGRIFGGALWDLRERVGQAVADSDLQYAKYLLSNNWENYFEDVLTVDDNDGNLTNGGPHHPEIYESFGIHGIGPGNVPKLDLTPSTIVEHGNGDGFYDPGENLALSFSVRDTRYLYPPPAQNVSVAVATDNPQLTINPTVFSLGIIAAGQTVQAPESLMISVAQGADLAFAKILFTITANGGSYQTADTVEIIVGHPEILLVDDDGNGIFQSFFNTALRQRNYVFTTHTVTSQGAVTISRLNQFQRVIWETGNASTNTLTTSDRNNLANYLNGGHDLLITGQNLVEDIGSTTFFSNYLKASPISGSVYDFSLDGVAGDPISDGDTLWIIGGGGAMNQTSPGAIAALSGAEEIFYYHFSSTHPPGAIRYDSGNFKTVTFAFGLEGISGLGNTSTLADLLNSILNWLEMPNIPYTGVAATVANPQEFALGKPFPNPFNARTSIPLRLPQRAQVKVEIYNLQGQRITLLQDGMMEAGNHALRYDASALSSGMYFLKVAAFDERGESVLAETSKLVLLK